MNSKRRHTAPNIHFTNTTRTDLWYRFTRKCQVYRVTNWCFNPRHWLADSDSILNHASNGQISSDGFQFKKLNSNGIDPTLTILFPLPFNHLKWNSVLVWATTDWYTVCYSSTFEEIWHSSYCRNVQSLTDDIFSNRICSVNQNNVTDLLLLLPNL